MPDPDYTPTAEMVEEAAKAAHVQECCDHWPSANQPLYLEEATAALTAARAVDPLVGEVERLREALQNIARTDLYRGNPHAPAEMARAALNPEEAPLAEPLERIPGHTSASTDGFTYVQIDRLPYKVAVRSYTSVEVRKFAQPPIAADRDLWLQIPGEPDQLIRDDDSVQIGPNSGTRFWTHPTHINGG